MDNNLKDKESIQELALLLNNDAATKARSGNYKEAKNLVLGAINIYNRLLVKLEDATISKDFAQSLSQLAFYEAQLGETREARTHYAKAIEILQKVVNELKDESSSINLIRTAIQYANLIEKDNSEQEALDILNMALRIGIDLNTNFDTLESKRLLALIGKNIGTFLLKNNYIEEAEAFFLKSLKWENNIPAKSKEDKECIIKSTLTLGEIYRSTNRLEEAEEAFNKAFVFLTKEDIKFSNIEDVDLKREIPYFLFDFGVLEQSLDKDNQARSMFLKSLEIFKTLKKTDPSFEIINMIGEGYYNLGLLEVKRNNPPGSIKFFRKALNSRVLLFDKFSNTKALHKFINNLIALGKVYNNLNDFHHAENSYLEALNLQLQMIEINPNYKFASQYLDNLNNLGVIQLRMRRFENATLYFKSLIQNYQEILDRDQTEENIVNLNKSLDDLFRTYMNLNEFKEAEKILLRIIKNRLILINNYKVYEEIPLLHDNYLFIAQIYNILSEEGNRIEALRRAKELEDYIDD